MTGPQALDIVRSLGVTQAKFARLTGVTPQALTKWGKGHPPSATMAALLKLLQARPELVHVLGDQ